MTLRILTVLLLPAFVIAAPLPKVAPAPAPKTSAEAIIGTLKLEANGMMSFHYSGFRQKAVLAQETLTVLVDGKEVTSTVNITKLVPEPSQLRMNLPAKSNRITDVKGEAVPEDDLKKKLEGEVTVVRVMSQMDPEWRKFFADDVLFIEVGNLPVARGVAGPGGALPVPPPIPLPPDK
jgi:hypothetical protein